jgi:hypothetical protein
MHKVIRGLAKQLHVLGCAGSPDPASVAFICVSLGFAYTSVEEHWMALQAFKRAYTEYREAKSSRDELAYVQLHVGNALRLLGRSHEAFKTIKDARSVLVEEYGESHRCVRQADHYIRSIPLHDRVDPGPDDIVNEPFLDVCNDLLTDYDTNADTDADDAE